MIRAPEVLIASDTGYLYAVDAGGEELWRAHLGFAVNDVAVADLDGAGGAEIVAAGEDGLLHVFAGDGEVLRTIPTADAARLVCIPATGDDALILAATARGEVLAW